jgi:peroxiredoxin
MVWAENELGGVRVYRFDPEAFKAGRKSAVFPTAPARFLYPSQASDGSGLADFEGASPTQKKWNQFGPRVGLAWDPTGKGRTSIRASYGIAYDLSPLSALINSNNVSPWALDVIHRNGTLDNPWQGFAGGNPFPFDWRTNPKFSDGSVFLAFAPDGKIDTTYTQSWNLAVQHEIAGRWRVSASYLDNRAVKLWLTEATNPALILTPQSHPNLFTGADTCVLEGQSFTPCNQLGNINQRRELRLWAAANKPSLLSDARLFSTIDTYRSHSSSNYHALLTTVRGTIRGVTLDADYTWAHCISDRVNVAISNPNQSPHDSRRDRANFASDRRRIFNMTAVAETPRFAGPFLRAVASGWRLSAITRISSGNYLTITTSDRALTGLTDQVANQVLDNVYLDKSGKLGSQFLNRAAFAQPALGAYGNMGYFSVRGFGTWGLDTALSRAFNIGERQRFEVRAEAFNVTNSVRPNNPGVNALVDFNAGNFGRITSVQDPRIMQFALKYVFRNVWNPMMRHLSIFLLLVFATLTAAGKPAEAVCDANGKTANLNFTFKDMSGADITLSSYKGRVILLDFWATWCGPCKVEVPAFRELYKKYQAQGLVVFGLSMDDSASDVRSFMSAYDVNYPVFLAKDRDDVQDAFAPLWGLPVTFVIGRDGKVCKKHTVFATKDQFEREIKALLAKR